MPKYTTIGQRMIFENARQLLIDNGYDPDTAELTQSFIRTEAAMATGTTKYHLPVIVTDQQNGSMFSTEKRLQLSDVFIVSSLNVQVAKPSTSTDGGFALYNYANLAVFSTSTTAVNITGAFCNGNLSMLIDNNQMLPAWDLDQHYRAPLTQQGANVGYTASAVNLVDSRDGSNDGIAPVEPNFILAGNANIDFSLNLVTGLAAVETNSRWIVRLRGVLAQNVSKIANNKRG